ncbi:MAG: putative DNA binding domain-containing protein [Acidobacteria bacterium]|nr:putative DNA binding domain-containing protein [Acidobacteriota bacterium]
MNEQKVRALIAGGETLTVEFKSDVEQLPDAELIEVVVCLTNAQGGTLVVGVEDDGKVTGLHPKHQTHPGALAAFIASRTVPPVSVEADFAKLPEGMVAVLVVPAARQPVSTSDGRLLVRYLDSKGKPGCRPLYSHELLSWKADRGLADFSALPVTEARWEDLDPLEFARLRRMVEEYHGDTALLELDDERLARALGLIRAEDRAPTVAGLLLVGKESALREYLPAHEVAFQVLRGSDVAMNEFRRWPLLRIYEWVVQAIDVRNEERELMVGAFRVGVPRYDRRGFREAISNALIHRDYRRLGAIHVQLHDHFMLVSNPGGFVAGVRSDTLLTATPHPRNPLLADAFKRVGLVERTGRGVGIIYGGQLQNGRPAPDYSRSTEVSVSVSLSSRPADLDFVLLAIHSNRKLGRALTAEDLLILWEIWRQGPTDISILAQILQQGPEHAREVLADLIKVGLAEADDSSFRIAPGLQQNLIELFEAGIADPAVYILGYLQQHDRITRQQVVKMYGLSEKQAEYRLKQLVTAGRLRLVSKGRSAHYVLA